MGPICPAGGEADLQTVQRPGLGDQLQMVGTYTAYSRRQIRFLTWLFCGSPERCVAGWVPSCPNSGPRTGMDNASCQQVQAASPKPTVSWPLQVVTSVTCLWGLLLPHASFVPFPAGAAPHTSPRILNPSFFESSQQNHLSLKPKASQHWNKQNVLAPSP